MPPQNGFPPGVVPPKVPLPRQSMGQQQPIIYSPVFQRPLMAQYREYPYLIIPDTSPMVTAANGTATSQFTIQGDNDYFLETLRYTSSGAFTLQITDTRSGAQWMSAPTHILLIGGTAQLPGYWSQLDVLVAPQGSRATLRVDVADLSGATNTIFLAISGRRQLVNPGMPRTTLTQEG